MMLPSGKICNVCHTPEGCVRWMGYTCPSCEEKEINEMYEKIGFKKNSKGEWYNPKKVTGGFVREPVDVT